VKLKVGDRVRTTGGTEGIITSIDERTEYDVTITGTSPIAEHLTPEYKDGEWRVTFWGINENDIKKTA
jgi:hypothetical protein